MILRPPPPTPHIPIRTTILNQEHSIRHAEIGTNTTITMPQIGFGTYKFQKGTQDAYHAVLEALNCGYRHIDTAFVYGGEETEIQVGKALQSSNITREELFITTKQWRAYHGYEPTLQCLELSLNKLQLEYVDLYLIHWPGSTSSTTTTSTSTSTSTTTKQKDMPNSTIVQLRSETWRAMEDALLQRKVKSIGVSNFTIQHLETLKKTARLWPPAVNQIELHPYNYRYQKDLIEYCNQEGIVIEAYASLGGQDCGKKSWNVLGGKLLERPEVSAMADKYNVTEAQVLLRWAMQHGFAVIPKSSNLQHMKMNLESALDGTWMNMMNNSSKKEDHDGRINKQECHIFGLSDEEMRCLDTLPIAMEDKMMSSTSSTSSSTTESLATAARLTWMRDPCRMLNFE
jgi:aldehyde reductase